MDKLEIQGNGLTREEVLKLREFILRLNQRRKNRGEKRIAYRLETKEQHENV